jgi:hypothetical protein
MQRGTSSIWPARELNAAMGKTLEAIDIQCSA